jgi:hypothetical protein
MPMTVPNKPEFLPDEKRELYPEPGETTASSLELSTNQPVLRIGQDQKAPRRSSLDEEINMLRVVIRRVFNMTDQVDDVQDAVKTLGALGMAATRLARLLEAQKNLGQGDETTEVLSEVLTGLLKEWGRI